MLVQILAGTVIDGVLVQRGDMIVADADGIISLPQTAVAQQKNHYPHRASLPASLEAACETSREQWWKKGSGRRGSNPRQPAWKAGTLPLSYSRNVGVRRLELRTSWSQTRRATNCATPRRVSELYHACSGLSSFSFPLYWIE